MSHGIPAKFLFTNTQWYSWLNWNIDKHTNDVFRIYYLIHFLAFNSAYGKTQLCKKDQRKAHDEQG